MITLLFASTGLPNIQAQIITTIAVNGLQDYSGNGGLAILSENLGPWGTMVDKSGNIYFADPGNSGISKVDVHGIISRFAGMGVPGSVKKFIAFLALPDTVFIHTSRRLRQGQLKPAEGVRVSQGFHLK